MASSKPYTRLTRDTSGVGTYSSLWLASDHLMIVTASGVSENYARVDLRDIQAFFLTPTNRRMGWGIGWGVLCALSFILMFVNLSSPGGPIASTFFFIVALVALTWNHLLSEGCAVYVVTRVQTAKLSPLIRMRKARKVLARLEPLVQAAQADLPPVAWTKSGLIPPVPTASNQPTPDNPSPPAAA